MDYEKKYNEALERAKELIAQWTGKNKDVYTEDYSYIFPELRESENERIRKALIDGVRQIRCKNDITQEQMIAYLEKQTKQKPAEWSEDNIKELTDFEAAMLHIGMSFFGGSAGLNPNNTNEVKKQAKLLLELVPKQEWSEEDEKMLNRIIDILNRTFSVYSALGTSSTKPSCPTYKDEITWLKSLRPQSKDEIYKEKDKAYKLGKHYLAVKFMNYLDENRPEGKMSLSNGECEDIDRAFGENDWAKILRYAEKYGKKN